MHNSTHAIIATLDCEITYHHKARAEFEDATFKIIPKDTEYVLVKHKSFGILAYTPAEFTGLFPNIGKFW